MSADFPGEAQSFVENIYCGETKTLFLQGCAGDIRPNLPGYPYRCANEADIQWCGRDLGCAVLRSLAKQVTREARPCEEKSTQVDVKTFGKTQPPCASSTPRSGVQPQLQSLLTLTKQNKHNLSFFVHQALS